MKQYFFIRSYGNVCKANVMKNIQKCLEKHFLMKITSWSKRETQAPCSPQEFIDYLIEKRGKNNNQKVTFANLIN